MVVLRARLFVSSSLLSISKEVSSTAGMCVRLVHRSSCCYSHVSVAVEHVHVGRCAISLDSCAYPDILIFGLMNTRICTYGAIYVPHVRTAQPLNKTRISESEWMNEYMLKKCLLWLLTIIHQNNKDWKYCDYIYTTVTYTGVRPHKCINIHCQHTWTIEYQNKTINIGENENKTQTTHAIHVKSTRFLWKMKRKLAIRHCADTNTREKSTPLCIGIGIGEWDDLCSFREIKWLLYQLQASITDICFN